jgi:hypothetical protein
MINAIRRILGASVDLVEIVGVRIIPALRAIGRRGLFPVTIAKRGLAIAKDEKLAPNSVGTQLCTVFSARDRSMRVLIVTEASVLP